VKNSSSTVDARYHAIVDGLAPDAIDELWIAALFGGPVRTSLRDRLVRLDSLRDDVGYSSARRRVAPIGRAS